MTPMTLIAAYDPLAGWLGLSIVLHMLFWIVVIGLGRLGVWEALTDPDTLERWDEVFSPQHVTCGLLAQTVVLVAYLTIQTIARQF